jgi:hypothetical protein
MSTDQHKPTVDEVKDWWKWILSIPADRSPFLGGQNVNESQNRITFCLACTGGLGSRGSQDLNRVLDARGKSKAILIPVFVAAYTADEVPQTVSVKDPLAYAQRLVNPQNMSADNFSKSLVIDNVPKETFLIEDVQFTAEIPNNHVLDQNLPAGTYQFNSSGWWYKIPVEDQDGYITVRFGWKNKQENFETDVQYIIKK